MEKTGTEPTRSVPLHEMKRGTLQDLIGTPDLSQTISQRSPDSRYSQQCPGLKGIAGGDCIHRVRT